MKPGKRQGGLELVTPKSERAERACLALTLGLRTGPADDRARAVVLARITAEDMTSEARRAILRAVEETVQAGATPSLQETAERIGAEHLGELLDCYQAEVTPCPADAEHWIRRVVEQSARRKLADSSLAIRDMLASDEDTADVIQAASDTVEQVKAAAIVGTELQASIKAAAMESFDELERVSKGGSLGLSTGLVQLDRILVAMEPGQLIIVAGRPSMGKTVVAGHLALHAAREGVRVAFVSKEMGRCELFRRFLSSEARFPHAKIRAGEIGEGQWPEIIDTTTRLAELPIGFLDRGDMKWPGIESRLRAIKAQSGLGLIVIDYLQIIDSGQRIQNRTQDLSWITGRAKDLARDLEVPVVLLSQLSRQVESRTDKRPVLSDLRDSGAIEQDADVVILLYREDYYLGDRCPPEQRGELEMIVAKSRPGETGTAKAVFRRWCLSLSDPIEQATREVPHRSDLED